MNDSPCNIDYIHTYLVVLERINKIFNLFFPFIRCRFESQYCCGYKCCYAEDDGKTILGSWYFWSLMSLVLIVFGCIVCSFTLSNLIKKQPTTNGIPNSWMGLLSGNKKKSV